MCVCVCVCECECVCVSVHGCGYVLHIIFDSYLNKMLSSYIDVHSIS